MPHSLLKLKDYDIHAVTTVSGNNTNANIVSWAMQTDMNKKVLVVALYKPDYTITLAKESGLLNLHWLGRDFAKHLSLLGRKSGREINKLLKINYESDFRGCPVLLDAIGCLHLEVINWADAGDHELAICRVAKQTWLHQDKEMLRLSFLREKGLVRG